MATPNPNIKYTIGLDNELIPKFTGIINHHPIKEKLDKKVIPRATITNTRHDISNDIR